VDLASAVSEWKGECNVESKSKEAHDAQRNMLANNWGGGLGSHVVGTVHLLTVRGRPLFLSRPFHRLS
jgi:hypothetical protein